MAALDFHHLRDKVKRVSDFRSLDKMRKEAEKCVVLCANCHREVECGFTQLEEKR